jgi:LmbE family N-acetylglucosaminyl deacetylase
MRTTIVYSPHPDDETLYLSGYVTFCRNRGDRLILVAVTDGGASNARPADWSVEDLMAVRRHEQHEAWRSLTGQVGSVYRLGIPDGEIAAHAQTITNYAEALERAWDTSVEHYVAGNYQSSQSEDHQAVANAVKAAGVTVARFALVPGSTSGTAYAPPTDRVDECLEAWNVYRAFGQISVKSMFDALKASGYTSHIIA